MSTWKIKDLELEFDWNDAEDTERFDKAEGEIQEKNLQEQMLAEGITQTEQTKIYVQGWSDYFDAIFGEGTGEKLFEGRKNRVITGRVVRDYIRFMQRARQEATEEDIKIGDEIEQAGKDLEKSIQSEQMN